MVWKASPRSSSRAYPLVLTPLKRVDVQPAEATPFAGQEERLAEAAQFSSRRRARSEGRHVLDSVPWRGQQHWTGGASYPVGARPPREPPRRTRHERPQHRPYRARGGSPSRAPRPGARVATRGARRERCRRLASPGEQKQSARGGSRSIASTGVPIQAADSVALEITALGALAEAREEFERQALKVEAAVRSVQDRVFEARLDAAKIDELVQELRPLREVSEFLGARLRRGVSVRRASRGSGAVAIGSPAP